MIFNQDESIDIFGLDGSVRRVMSDSCALGDSTWLKSSFVSDEPKHPESYFVFDSDDGSKSVKVYVDSEIFEHLVFRCVHRDSTNYVFEFYSPDNDLQCCIVNPVRFVLQGKNLFEREDFIRSYSGLRELRETSEEYSY